MTHAGGVKGQSKNKVKMSFHGEWSVCGVYMITVFGIELRQVRARGRLPRLLHPRRRLDRRLDRQFDGRD